MESDCLVHVCHHKFTIALHHHHHHHHHHLVASSLSSKFTKPRSKSSAHDLGVQLLMCVSGELRLYQSQWLRQQVLVAAAQDDGKSNYGHVLLEQTSHFYPL